MNNVSKIIAASAIAIVGLSGVAFADDLNVVPQSVAANEAYADQVLTIAASSSGAATSTVSAISTYPANDVEAGAYADQVLGKASGQNQGIAHNVTSVPSRVN